MEIMGKNTKFALVTGASSGIGYACSIELSKRGYKVFSGARRLDSMKPLEKYGITIIQLDVTSIDSITAAKHIIEKETDHLDLLFNNAGVSCASPAIEVSDDALKQCFDVNLHSPIRLTREFRSLIIKGSGVLAYTSSTASMIPVPFQSIYSASKAGLNAYINTLALEVKPFGVKVVNVVSGAVKTDILDFSTPKPIQNSVYVVNGEDLVAKSKASIDTLRLMSVTDYAAQVVQDIENIANGKTWSYGTNHFSVFRGAFSYMAKVLSTILPRVILERMFLKSFGLADGFNLIATKQKRL